MINYSILDSDEIFALARVDFQKENYDLCLEKLKYIQSRNQIPVAVYSLLGRTYAVLELFERARDVFKIFLENVPNALQERFHLGMVEKDLGNTDGAIKYWDEVLEAESAFIPALYHKAVVCVENNSLQDASQLISQLLDVVPEGDQYAVMARELSERIHLQ